GTPPNPPVLGDGGGQWLRSRSGRPARSCTVSAKRTIAITLAPIAVLVATVVFPHLRVGAGVAAAITFACSACIVIVPLAIAAPSAPSLKFSIGLAAAAAVVLATIGLATVAPRSGSALVAEEHANGFAGGALGDAAVWLLPIVDGSLLLLGHALGA